METIPSAGQPEERRARKTRGKGFHAGLTTPSVLSLGTAFLVLWLGLLLSCIIVTPQRLSRGLDRYFSGGGNEEYLHLLVHALRFEDRKSANPVVLVLGGSLAMGAIVEEELEAALGTRLAAAIDVEELTSSRQTLWESVAILERVPKGTRGLVVLFVGPTKMAIPSDEISELYQTPRLGFRSDFIDQVARGEGIRPPPRTGIYLLDNRLFFQPRLTHTMRNIIKAAIGRHLPSEYRFRYPGHTLASHEWTEGAARVRQALTDYAGAVEGNLRIIDSLLGVLGERTNMSLILVESPVNPRFRDEWISEIYALHLAKVGSYASSRGLPYLAIQPALSLDPEDFFDWAHLARETVGLAFTSELADELSPILSEVMSNAEEES